MPGITGHASPDTLGAEVRRLREQTRRSIRDVTDQLGWSGSKLSRIETGHSGITGPDLDKLLVLYDANQEDRSRIGAIAAMPTQRARRLAYVLPGALERYMALEERATDISLYQPMVVPALLQTPEYAAAIIKADPRSSGPVESTRIETRLVRQAVLARQSGPRLNIVLDEAVLRRIFGDASIMRRQMLRLIEIGERPNTSIRVLSFSAGTHPAQVGHFAILSFADDSPPHVFCDGLTGGILRSRPEDVHLYQLCFQGIADVALDEHESAGMFSAAADSGWAR